MNNNVDIKNNDKDKCNCFAWLSKNKCNALSTKNCSNCSFFKDKKDVANYQKYLPKKQ